MRLTAFCISVLSALGAVNAANIVITVGGNTTNNASLVFQPQRVTANLGDTVIFNFTLGNHTAIQSSFSQPCIPSTEATPSFNGFNSGFRLAGNGSNITILTVPLLEENYQEVMWFYDYNTCGEGGVGVINSNESSTETLAGYERNAERLNGTATSSSAAPSSTAASSSSSASASASSSSNTSDADRAIRVGGSLVIPMMMLAVALAAM